MTRQEAERRAREIHDMVVPVAHHASMDGHERCAKCDKIAAALISAVEEERESGYKLMEYEIAAAVEEEREICAVAGCMRCSELLRRKKE